MCLANLHVFNHVAAHHLTATIFYISFPTCKRYLTWSTAIAANKLCEIWGKSLQMSLWSQAVSFKNQLGRVKFSWPPRIPRRTITTAFVSTLSVAGLGWLVFGHEPFASKLEPVTSAVKKMMRGGRVPTVPTENNERGSRRSVGLNSSNNNSSNNPEEYNQTMNFAQR